MALEVSIAGGDAQYVGCAVVNGEFVGVIWSAGHSVAPSPPAVDRRHEGSSFDRDPQSF
jgi:hypothetical protein